MQKLPTAVALATATLLGLPGVVHAATAPGSLDDSYGLDGSAAAFDTPLPFAVDALADGTTATSGPVSFTGGPNAFQYGIFEHTVTGRRVRAYGDDGLASVTVASSASNQSLAGPSGLSTLASDGRAYVVGVPTAPAQGDPPAVTVTRVTPQGGLDPTFGVGVSGVATIAYTSNDSPSPVGVAARPDGSSVVVVLNGATIDVVRLSAGGDVVGKSTIVPAAAPSTVSRPLVLSDGSVLVSFSADTSGNGSTIHVAKLRPNGTPDTSWGTLATPGITDTGLPGGNNGGIVIAPVARPSGGVLVLSPTAGGDPVDPTPSVVALTPTGALDSSFSGDGVAPLGALPGQGTGFAFGLDVQPNGSILATEAVQDNNGFSGTLRRLRTDGSRDTTFGSGGVVDTGASIGTAVRFVPVSGRAIVASVTQNGGGIAGSQLRGYVANVPPAVAVTGPAEATPGAQVTFDASGTKDSDGTVASYAWDLDGDGRYDDATGARVTTSFPTAGERTVSVRATDDQGTQATGNRAISVQAAPTTTTEPTPPPAVTTTVTTPSTAPPVTVQVPVPVPVPVPTPATTGTTPTATPPATGARPTLRSTKLTLDAKGRVALRLKCASGTAKCTGTVALRLGTKAIGSASYSVAAGKTATVRVTVQRAQRTKALAKRAKLTVRIAPTGGSAASKAVTLKRARR